MKIVCRIFTFVELTDEITELDFILLHQNHVLLQDMFESLASSFFVELLPDLSMTSFFQIDGFLMLFLILEFEHITLTWFINRKIFLKTF